MVVHKYNPKHSGDQGKKIVTGYPEVHDKFLSSKKK